MQKIGVKNSIVSVLDPPYAPSKWLTQYNYTYSESSYHPLFQRCVIYWNQPTHEKVFFVPLETAFSTRKNLDKLRSL